MGLSKWFLGPWGEHQMLCLLGAKKRRRMGGGSVGELAVDKFAPTRRDRMEESCVVPVFVVPKKSEGGGGGLVPGEESQRRRGGVVGVDKKKKNIGNE